MFFDFFMEELSVVLSGFDMELYYVFGFDFVCVVDFLVLFFLVVEKCLMCCEFFLIEMCGVFQVE